MSFALVGDRGRRPAYFTAVYGEDEAARRVGLRPQTVKRLLKSVNVRNEERSEDMGMPTHEENPFWTPTSVEQGAELAADLRANGVDPDVLAEWPSAPRKTRPAGTSDLSLEQQWRELLGEGFHRRPREETGGSADLSDDALFRVQKHLSTMSNAEFGEASRKLAARYAALPEEPTTNLTDEELYQWGQEVLDGTAARQQARRNVAEAAREREDYWRHAYRERDEPLPRDLEEDLLP